MIPAALALALALSAPPARALLEDGMEVVVHRIPGAPTTSLRLVVRAGGAHDPRGKAGLAHLVEHCIFSGTYDVRGPAFRRDVRRAGAVLNAHTYGASTRYELDAPAESFAPLAERYLRMVTSPAWELTDLRAELGVIRTEGATRDGDGLLAFVERALFPGEAKAATLIGSAESRDTLRREDVVGYYLRHYLPGNMTAVFAGDVDLDQAKAILARSVRLPPALPGEVPAPAAEAPSLPMEQRVPAGITATMLGYHLARWDAEACEGLSALVELRAIRDLRIHGPRVSSVEVQCSRLRGQPFLLAFAFTRRLDAGDLPASMERVLREAAERPASGEEKALVAGRLSRLSAARLADPARSAEALAEAAAEPRAGELTDLSHVGAPPRPDAAAWGRLAAESFRPDRRVLLDLSPLQN